MLFYRVGQVVLLAVVLCFSSACGGGGGDGLPVALPEATSAVNYSYSGSGSDVDLVSTPETDTANLALSYTLNLGSAVKDVYLVFTNPTLVDGTVAPSISGLSLAVDLLAGPEPLAAEVVPLRPPAVGTRGTPGISRFNADPDSFLAVNKASLASSLAPSLAVLPAQDPTCDDTASATTGTFKTVTDINNLVDTASHCRVKVVDGATTLYIWVANDSWSDSCGKSACVDATMANTLAAKFLGGTGGDIYDWIKNIYGDEWGTAAANNSNLIADNGTITILLYDIDGDNSTNGGTTGFFWAKDNYLAATYSGSNERLMFYIDSVLYATPENVGSWLSTDHWPSEIYGTLAHEFQHMINFYQKNIVKGAADSEVWLNEMASVVAEDFVASKLHIDGPRGVSYLDGSSGGSDNTSGWLPYYCRYDYVPVAQWFTGSAGDDNVLNSYAANYSFGAYLARNYGGVTFFKNLVQNDKVDYQAIDYALAADGYTDDFATVLRKWGAAVLLSDDASNAVPSGYRYNTGVFIDSTAGSTTYSLGSINMFNYHHPISGQSGPRIYTSLPPTDSMAGKYKTGNMFYKWGTGLSGLVSKVITIPKGSKLTVVIK